MIASLPQTPAQTGLASILAALGQAAPAGTAADAPGFEQLFASLPEAATTETPAMTIPNAANAAAVPPGTQPAAAASIVAASIEAQPVPVTTPAPPAAALFGLPQTIADTAAAEARPAETTTKAATVPKVETPPATDAADAAAAATLLIAVATPMKPTTSAASDKGIAAPETDVTESDKKAAPAAPASLPAAAIVEAPVAATIVATTFPAAEKPLTEKASKPAAASLAASHADATATMPATAPKTAEAAQPHAAPIASTEPKTAKPIIDAGASMTVLFTSAATQGAAPLAEAAKAAPLAERTLDLSSDDQWIAQLAADIAATKSDKGDISFRLMPRHLGRLDVSMLSGDEGVTVKLDTHHEATATIVQAAQPRLVEDLRQQGVRVADAQVTHTPAEAGRQQQNQSQGRGATPDASHLIETAADQAAPTHDERTADRRGRFA